MAAISVNTQGGAPKKSEHKSFPGFQKLFFEAPLYAEFKYPETDEEKRGIVTSPIDGHCPMCKDRSPFHFQKIVPREWLERGTRTTEVLLKCGRNDRHILRYYILFGKGTLQKIGQFPSYASVAQDALKTDRKFLTREDGVELHTAIGLAAHGVGIGSFVYVRRIFERLIRKRFEEFKDREGWSEDQFSNLRMPEKIDFLRDHLPEFMVRNKRLYSILSLGIHELDEEGCLNFFEMAKTSILAILEEDRRKKEELAMRSEVEEAIAAFNPPT